MSCKYCDGMYGVVPELPCDNRDVGVLITTQKTIKGLRVMKVVLYPNGRENYMTAEALCGVSIAFCPMCGRKL